MNRLSRPVPMPRLFDGETTFKNDTSDTEAN